MVSHTASGQIDLIRHVIWRMASNRGSYRAITVIVCPQRSFARLLGDCHTRAKYPIKNLEEEQLATIQRPDMINTTSPAVDGVPCRPWHLRQ